MWWFAAYRGSPSGIKTGAQWKARAATEPPAITTRWSSTAPLTIPNIIEKSMQHVLSTRRHIYATVLCRRVNRLTNPLPPAPRLIPFHKPHGKVSQSRSSSRVCGESSVTPNARILLPMNRCATLQINDGNPIFSASGKAFVDCSGKCMLCVHVAVFIFPAA